MKELKQQLELEPRSSGPVSNELATAHSGDWKKKKKTQLIGLSESLWKQLRWSDFLEVNTLAGILELTERAIEKVSANCLSQNPRKTLRCT